MRDISAGRDIIDSSITEIVGSNPSPEILQQPAEELAEAEKLSRKVVSGGRKKRASWAAVLSVIALVLLAAACLMGYFWLLDSGEVRIADIIRDSSSIAMGELVSTLVAALVGLFFGSAAYWQKEPKPAEVINQQRLKTISVRWNELEHLGLPKSEIRYLRKRR